MKTHTGEQPHLCGQCDKSFSTFSNLKTHKAIHTWELPFSCLLCEKSFSRAGTLKTHMKVHISSAQKKDQIINSGFQLFSCHQCDKSFTTIYRLKIFRDTR
jgi:KRAB domain-containing zinc finger protein